MVVGTLNAMSAYRASANYGQNITPVRSAKKVRFEDAAVIPVGRGQEESKSPQASSAQKISSVQAKRNEKAMNAIASHMQGQNAYYDSAMQGGTYSVVGSIFDATA